MVQPLEVWILTVLLVSAALVILLSIAYLSYDRVAQSRERLAYELLFLAQVFDQYAELHRAKGTPDADFKAQRNATLAENARRVVLRWGGR